MSLFYSQEKHSRTLSAALQHCNLTANDFIEPLMQEEGLAKPSDENNGLIQRLVHLK